MPELPEVETVRLGLQPVLEGRRFAYVETRRADLRVAFPADFSRRLTGRRVMRLRRRAKYILADLDNGETLVIYGRPSPSKADHTQLRFWSTAIEKDVKELAAAGIVFDELDMGAIKTVNHIATVPGIGRSAWFKDPDGNTLALFQPE